MVKFIIIGLLFQLVVVLIVGVVVGFFLGMMTYVFSRNREHLKRRVMFALFAPFIVLMLVVLTHEVAYSVMALHRGFDAGMSDNQHLSLGNGINFYSQFGQDYSYIADAKKQKRKRTAEAEREEDGAGRMLIDSVYSIHRVGTQVFVRDCAHRYYSLNTNTRQLTTFDTFEQLCRTQPHQMIKLIKSKVFYKQGVSQRIGKKRQWVEAVSWIVGLAGLILLKCIMLGPFPLFLGSRFRDWISYKLDNEEGL